MRLRAHQRAMETDEVCDRPLETFGADTPIFLGFSRYRWTRLTLPYLFFRQA